MGYGFSSNHGEYTLPVLHLHSMSGDAFTIPSPSRGLAHEPNPNSNPQQQQQQQQTKKKRNLAGTPDPDAEVLALSPRTLMATNRFVCEICNKGFQRDQNLQLHRRGHNLPWKLRQRDPGQEARKRVYVCPESSCVHHDPSRALGDLTGIKKHYSRKHGEKKWKCEKCSKRYAVYSDWKSHSKICGTREYKCDCGILFSRKDSFITHRAFCDAFAQESTRLSSSITADPSFQQDDATATLNGINFHANGNQMFEAINYTPEAPLQDVAAMGQPTNNLSFWLGHYSHLNPSVGMQANGPNITADTSVGLSELLQISSTNARLGSSSSVMNYVGECSLTPQMPIPGACLPLSTTPFVLMEANNVKGKDSVLVEGLASIYSNGNSHRQCSIPAGTHMSATGLLQKAAQMGATVSDPSATSFLSGLLTSPESIHRNLQTHNEFQLFVQEKAMPESFQEMMMSSFPSCNILADGDNNMVSRLMMENHVQTLGPPLQRPPSFLTRDFLGLGGDRSDQSILQQELAKLASMGPEMNMMSSSYSGIGGC